MMISLALFALALLTSSGHSFVATPPPNNTFLEFVHFWRPEECFENTNENCLSITQNTTIHGIWPTYLTGSSYPSDCSNIQLTESDISDLETALNENWVSYEEDNFDFWSHEWSKHGTCWKLDPHDFFKQGLAWHSDNDIPGILRSNGVKQDASPSKSSIESLLAKNMYGTSVHVTCENGGKFVNQIVTCFDWNGDPLDCLGPLSSACPDQIVFSSWFKFLVHAPPLNQDERRLTQCIYILFFH